MLYEAPIKTFNRLKNEDEYNSIIGYANLYGVSHSIVADHVILPKLPSFLLKKGLPAFDHYILSGYYGSRFGKNVCKLFGISKSR